MKIKLISSVIGLAIALFGNTMAKANFTMGNTYGTPMTITYTEGNNAIHTINGAGGNFGGIGQATLNGTSLAYVYCIDLFDDISLNTSYNASVTNNGSVAQTTAHAIGNANSNGFINNAAAIAWLIDSQAGLAISGNLQSGLQAAIWTELYGPMGGSGPNSWNIVGMALPIQQAMLSDLAYLALASDFINTHSNALINSVYWIDPSNGTTQYQQQVGANAVNLSSMPSNQLSTLGFGSRAIAEPEVFLLLSIGLIGFVLYRYKWLVFSRLKNLI